MMALNYIYKFLTINNKKHKKMKLTKTKEYTSVITVSFHINNHEAISKKDYIETLKLQFAEQYDIDLKNHEITNIERIK
jgi:hypothetical protein